MPDVTQMTILTTVNAPYQTSLDASELAQAISMKDFKVAQVGSFLTEVPVVAQLAFAEALGIPKSELKATATEFAHWSGQLVPLAT